MLDHRPIKSPCVSVCVMDPSTGWCEGCYRTLAEIGGWSRFSAAERDRVLLMLPMRRKAVRTQGNAETEVRDEAR